MLGQLRVTFVFGLPVFANLVGKELHLFSKALRHTGLQKPMMHLHRHFLKVCIGRRVIFEWIAPAWHAFTGLSLDEADGLVATPSARLLLWWAHGRCDTVKPLGAHLEAFAGDVQLATDPLHVSWHLDLLLQFLPRHCERNAVRRGLIFDE